MKKVALTTLTVAVAAGLAVPVLAETTTSPASLTYARARSGGDARPYVVPPEVKAQRALWLKARADWTKHREAMRPLWRKSMILKLELKILMLQDKINKKAVLAKVKQIADVKGKIMAERIFFRLAMKKKYPQLGRFRRGFRRGWRGHGPGHGWRGRGPGRGWHGRGWGAPCFQGGPGGPGRGWRRGPRFRGGPRFMPGGPGPMSSVPMPMAEGPGPMM